MSEQNTPPAADSAQVEGNNKANNFGSLLSIVRQFFTAKDTGNGMHVDVDDIPLEGISSNSDKSWFDDIFEPLRPAYKQTLFMALGINVIGLFASIFALQVYDRVIAKGGHNTLIALASGMVIAILVEFVLRGGRSALMRRIGTRIEISIARTVYQRLSQLSLLELESRSPAFWQAMFRDIELVRSVMAGAPALLLIDLPFIILTLILLSIIAPPLLVFALAIMSAFMFLAWRSEKVMRNAAGDEKKLMMNRDAVLADLTASRRHLKAVGPSPLLNEKWETQYAQWMENALDRSEESDKYRDISQSLMVSSTVLMTTFGAIAIMNQLMTMGALIAANILTGKLTSPMVQLVSQWRTFGQFNLAKQRLDELFSVQLDKQISPVAMPMPKGQVNLDSVCFTYPKTDINQVDDVSGRLGPTGLHVIVGNNGSGKTTLLKIMRGLYAPSAGRVLLDDADINQFGQNDLARWIGYLPQQPRLIQGTIKENLLLASSEISDEQIIHACKLSGAYDFITNLPDGFDTNVGEAGSHFSNGQRKRIAIAQTLMQDPKILLLDEPTSDLDSSAEQQFILQMKSLAKEKTVIVVSHSPNLLNHADGIVVMQNGKVSMAGPARDVLPKIGFTKSGDENVK